MQTKAQAYAGRPYKDGTPMFEIILDGWARGFLVSQTDEELKIMGFTQVSEFDIIKIWELLEDKMQNHFEKEAAKESKEFRSSFGVFD